MKAIDQWPLTAFEPSLGVALLRAKPSSARAGPLSDSAGRLIDPVSDCVCPRPVYNLVDKRVNG